MECKDPFATGEISTKGTGTSLGARSTQANAYSDLWRLFMTSTSTGAAGAPVSRCLLRLRCTFMLAALLILFIVILWESRKGGSR